MEIIKRDGVKETFNINKIYKAIEKAKGEILSLSEKKEFYIYATELLNNQVVDVEQIQNIVENWLMSKNWFKVAKKYILYREVHKQAREIRERLDYMNDYADNTRNAATSSETDPNANVIVKNAANLDGEVWKPKNRIVQRQRMKNKLHIMYPELAHQYIKDIENHIIYIHDEAQTPVLKPYCMAVTLYPLMTEGVGNIDNVTPSAPNGLRSFSGQISNLIFLLSSQCKGAVAVAEYFIALNYYVIKEFGHKWYDKLDVVITNEYSLKKKTIRSSIEDAFSQFVWAINQPAGNRGYQSPFTNLSYFDHTYFEGMFEHFYYPNGDQPEWKAIDTLQRMFMKWFNAIRLKQVLTFPVETFCMVHDGKDVIDQDYKKLCAEMYSEGHSFFTYLSDSVDSLASCCFSKDTKVKVKLNGEIKETTFLELEKNDIKNYIEIFNKGNWELGKLVVLPGRKMFEIETESGKKIVVSDNHLNLTSKGDIETDKLIVGDSLLTYDNEKVTEDMIKSIVELDSIPEKIYCFEMKNQDDPYFTLSNGIITHNCRLRNGLQENTFSPTSGMTGVMTGSCNVITLNISRIVQNCVKKEYLRKDFKNWSDSDYEILKDYLITLLDRVYKYHITYKTMLYEQEEKKMYSACNAGYISMSKLYSTIGINGLNEGARFLGLEVSNNEDYLNFLQFILGTIKEQNKLHSIHDKKRPFIFNSEVVPAEGLGSKNYNWDKEDGYWVPEDENLYNSYFYNAHDDTSVLDKFILHGRKTYDYTDGGSALHCNLENHLSKEQYSKLIDFAIEEGTSYFTFNIPNSKCEDCGFITKHPLAKCPKCGSENITQYTRVIGYLRPIKAFSKDRQTEAAKRFYSNNIND